MNIRDIAIMVVLIAFFVYALYFFFYPWEQKEFYMHTNVEDVIGFYINDTALMFGTIPPGVIGGKNITLENTEYNPKFVRITANGTIGNWVTVSDNNFIMPGNSEKLIKIAMSVPEGTEFGEYDGVLKISIKKLY